MAKVRDLTKGNIGKKLILFAIPMLLSSLVQQLYNTVDLIYAGNFLGKSASASIGASSLLITCLVGFFGGMSVGSGVVVSQIYGAGEQEKLKKAVQTISYAPHFISVVVLVGILNLFFNQGNGLINVFLDKMGFEKFGFLTSSAAFPSMYVWSGVWQNAGWNSIIYIAALAAIDPQLHEAAQIDGASRLQRILHINLPGILPTAIIMFILDVGQVMNMGFEKVFLMQNAQNTETSQVISTFVYEAGLINSDYGFSTAIGLFNNIINIVLLLTVNKIAKKISDTSLF